MCADELTSTATDDQNSGHSDVDASVERSMLIEPLLIPLAMSSSFLFYAYDRHNDLPPRLE
jgi:hypothetical protein